MKRTTVETDDRKASRAARATTNQRDAADASDRTNGRSTLQQSLGNQAVMRLAREGVVQAKLSVSDPNDRAEREAERVARAVTAPDADERTSDCDDADRDPTTDVRPSASVGVARRGGELPANVESTVRRAVGGGGESLPQDARETFESRMGADFSDVRVHTDCAADEAARSIGAEAYTMGSDVAFAKGTYDPESSAGRELLAHELAHVVQQDGATRRRVHRQDGSEKEDQESEDEEETVLSGDLESVPVASWVKHPPAGWPTDVGRAEFWEDLKPPAKQSVNQWVNQVLGPTIEETRGYLESQESQSMTPEILINAFGNLPVPGTGVAEDCMEILRTHDIRQGLPRGVTGFVSESTDEAAGRGGEGDNQADIAAEMRGKVVERIGEIAESRENDSFGQMRGMQTIRAELSQLPSESDIQQSIVDAWVRRTSQSDGGSESGGETPQSDQAVITISYYDGSSDPTASGLHDVVNPSGTVSALESAYGADTTVDQLPYPITIAVIGVSFTGSMTIQKVLTLHADGSGWDAELGVGESERSTVDDWLDEIEYPTIGELEPGRGLPATVYLQ